MNTPHAHHTSGSAHPFAFLGDLEKFFGEYLLDKAPFQLPASAREMLVKVAPYLTILFLIMGIPVVLALFGLGTFFGSTFMMTPYMPGVTMMFYITGILTVLIFILEIMAIPGLFSRSRKAWNLLFYAQLVSLISTVLSGSIVGALIGLIIGMYILFQVKSYYK